MARAAHSLAGSSANLGGREVWRIAKELRTCAKAGRDRRPASCWPVWRTLTPARLSLWRPTWSPVPRKPAS